jgi:hypothetical protein
MFYHRGTEDTEGSLARRDPQSRNLALWYSLLRPRPTGLSITNETKLGFRDR